MIIWINGSFGAGKTTLAYSLKKKIKHSFIYDPEILGSILSRIAFKKKEDFQDYQLWRGLNRRILKVLDYSGRVIIVPMTLTNKQYYEEIVGELKKAGLNIKHFILLASKQNLIERLDKRGDSTQWAYQQIDRCIKAFESDFQGCKIDSNGVSVEELAYHILKILDKEKV